MTGDCAVLCWLAQPPAVSVLWGTAVSMVSLRRHCPDSRRTFTKRLMLEKHIQLMHGIKDPDVKEMTEATNEEEAEVKEDTKVNHHTLSLQ